MTDLFSCALNAPLIAVRPRDRQTFHAVTMEEIVHGWKLKDDKPRTRLRFTTACGIDKVQLVGQDEMPVQWPPYLPKKPLVRCRDCYEATGKRRPRSRFVQNGKDQ